MSGKSWGPGEAKKFAKQARLNTHYYVINKHATNLGAYEDQKTYSVHVFTRLAPITGHLMTDGGTSAEGLCLRYGPVYDTKPSNMRDLAGPAPQVAGPVPEGYEAELDEAELLALQASVSRGSHPRKRRPAGSWRP